MVPVRPSTALGTALKSAMPRDGAIIFSDLIGKLDVLRVRLGRKRHPKISAISALARASRKSLCNGTIPPIQLIRR